MLSVIMPAYNEAKNLGKTIRETIKTLDNDDLKYEVIIVDDGSQDNTYEMASSLAQQYPSIRVLTYKKNMGRGYALKYGCQFAQGDLVLFIDADSDLPPSQILRFLEEMEKGDADVVNGSKAHPQSQVGGSFTRRFLSKGYNILVKVLFNLSVSDCLGAVKLFRREVLKQALPKVSVNGFVFALELLVNIDRLGYSIVEAPMELNYRLNSRVSIKGIPRIFLDTLAVFYRAKIRRHCNK